MLDLFYKYLAETIIGFFQSENPIKAGDRFFLYLENGEDADALYKALIETDSALTQPFRYTHKEAAKEFAADTINFAGINLIVASNALATENYLTTLRNLVSAQEEEAFKDTAILILFSGKLDSLIGGSSDLTKAGMPLNFYDFSKKIKLKINSSDALNRSEKFILKWGINKIEKELGFDHATIFDLAPLVRVVQKGFMAPVDYAALGLFPHQELESMPEKSFESLVKENEFWFETVGFSIKHGEPRVDLDKKMTTSGIKEIEDKRPDDQWQQIDFSEVKKWVSRIQSDKLVLYNEDNPKKISKGIQVWDRAEGETTAKKRLRNLIIFNPLGSYPIQIAFGFDAPLKGFLSQDQTPEQIAEVKLEGKNIILTVHRSAFNQDFIRFEYQDDKVKSNRFKFKVWAINMAQDLLEGIEASYTLELNGRLLINAEDHILFNRSQGEALVRSLKSGDQVNLRREESLKLVISPEEEEVLVPFTVHHEESTLNLSVHQEVSLPHTIKGWEVWQSKRVYKESFQHLHDIEKGTLKLLFRNQEYLVRDQFRQNLFLEVGMLNSQGLAWVEDENNTIQERTLRISDAMRSAFLDFQDYIKKAGKLPSLIYWDPELTKFAQHYMAVFLEEVNKMTDGKVLDETTQVDLLLLGTIVENYRAKNIKFSPLHPLVVAYQLELNEQLQDTSIYEAVLTRLTPLNLIPFLYWENPKNPQKPVLYAGQENNHSPEWLYFSHDIHFKQFSGRQFIRDLVKTKLEEFVSNFDYLFKYDQRAPIKINVFNMGDCLQVLQGIFDYYRGRVNTGQNPNDLRPVDLYIHGSDYYVTTFERMAHMTDLDDLQETFNISMNSKSYDLEDLIHAFRDKVHFYTLDAMQTAEYAHLTFYQFNNESIGETYRNTHSIPSGLALDGLLSEVPSYYDNQTYVSGFGTQYIEKTNALINMAKAYNALAKVAFTKDPFSRDVSICTTISSSIKNNLSDLYQHSQWVTFVDPHFDLSFFKEDDDLIIIHYSDQYSNASGFDAITVTRKTKQYQFLLEQILKEKQITYQPQEVLQLIDLYNAINGEWLLKLIGKKDENLKKEKLSLLSAIKNFLAFFDHPEVIWVPVSLEEILRISGGAGLKQAEGLFSAKNLGATEQHCDDLLMIGLFQKEGVLHLEFYPLEVKIGLNNSDVLKKARLQAEKTKALLDQHLTNPENPFQAKLYRAFFANLAIMNAGKMRLYNTWPEKNWEKVTEEYRGRLLNDQFKLSNILSSYIGAFGVMAFTQGELMRRYHLEERGTLITLIEEDGYNSLVKSVEQIKNRLLHTKNSIDISRLLVNQVPDLQALTVTATIVAKSDGNGESDADDEEDLGTEGDTPPEPSTPLPVDEILNTQEPAREMQILFGEDINDRKPIYWYPTNTSRVMHTNTGIIGTMGTGKTQFTKSLITQLYKEGKYNVARSPIGILIFDYKGDYIKEDFIQATDAKVYGLYHLPYNPLAIDVGANARHLLPLHIASTLQETISNAFGLGNKQKALLRDLIMAAYEDKGIQKADNTTWQKTAPTIADVCEKYLNQENASVDSLHAALTQLYEFEIFQPDSAKAKSLYDLLNGVTVINLSGYSSEIQNLIVAITLDAFYSQMQKHGHSKIQGDFRQLSKMVLVDEADNFLSKNFSSLKKILKEGREFGVGTILSTQFLDHFATSENDYSQYILTWIIHRVNEVKVKDVESLFSVADREQKEKLVQTIKKLEKHHSLVNLSGSKPILIEDLAFWKLTAGAVV